MHDTHIFFDLDHTLWDFDKNSELCFQQIFKEQQLTLDVDSFLKEYIPINFKYWKFFREEKITKAELRYQRLKETFDVLSYKITDELIHKIAEDYIKYLSDYNNLLDDAIPVLDYLSKKYTLHIITNGFKEVQHLKLKNSAIKKYFEVIVTSECVGVKKPNPKIFEYALSQVQTQAQNCIMIGDSLEADILGAQNLGIKPIYLDVYKKEKNKQNEFITIHSLIELKQYL